MAMNKLDISLYLRIPCVDITNDDLKYGIIFAIKCVNSKLLLTLIDFI